MQTTSHQKFLILTAFFGVLLASCGSSREFYLQRGDRFAAQGKDADAIIEYQKAIQKDSRYGQAYLRFGQFLAQRGKSQEALTELTQAEQFLPDSVEAQVALGRAALTVLLSDPRHVDPYRSADRMATRLLAKDSKSFEGLRIRGYIQMVHRQTKEAIESFQLALQVKPKHPEIVTILIQNLLADGRGDDVEKLAQGALEAGKNYGPLYDALYAYYMGAARREDAERLLKLKITNNPKEPFFVIQLADHFWGRNQNSQAEDLLRGFSSNTRDYPSAPLVAGDFYRRRGKPSEALTFYEAGRKSDQNRKLEYLERIVAVEVELGRNQEAAETLDSILKDFPDNTTALASRADLRMATGKPEEMRKALAEFAALVQKKPENSGFRYSLANAYRQMGREDEAEKELREILRRDPNDERSLREMADIAIRNRKPDDALVYAERLLAIDPNNTGALLVRTSAWALNGRFLEVAGELTRIHAQNPNLPEPQLQMATLNMQQRHYPEAEQMYRRLYEPGRKDFRALRGLVTVLLLEGQAQKALVIAQEEAKRSDNVEVRTLVAQAAAGAGKSELALSTAEKLAADFPENPDHWLFIGSILQQQGKLEEAIVSFRKAEAIAPSNPLTSAHLGDALGQAGRYGEAATAYRRSLKLQPGEPAYMNNLAWQLAMAGTNLDEAMVLARGALKSVPDNPQANDTIGMIYLKSGKGELALRTFQGLVQKEPRNSFYQLHLAMSMISVGQQGKARTELESALRNAPSSIEAAEIRKLLESTR